MAEPPPRAYIRPFQADDDEYIFTTIARSNMEPLGIANAYIYNHPITIAIWIAISSAFVQYMHWWPNPEWGWVGYLSPLPAFGCMFMPILVFVELSNRHYIEPKAEKISRGRDLVDIQSYYSRSKYSGLWTLIYDSTRIGFVAVDASTPDEMVESDLPKGKKKSDSTVAVIRHFYVKRIYRPANVQASLLEHAVKHVFGSNNKITTIKAPDSPLLAYKRRCFREAGFELQETGEKVGLLGWRLGMSVLSREKWENAQEKAARDKATHQSDEKDKST